MNQIYKIFNEMLDDIHLQYETYLEVFPKTGEQQLFGYGEKILNRLGITLHNDPFLCYFMTYVEENRPPPEYNLNWNEISKKEQIDPKLRDIFAKVSSDSYINMKLHIDPKSARIDRHRTLTILKAELDMAISDMKDRQKIIDDLLKNDSQNNQKTIQKLIEKQKTVEKYAIHRKISLDQMLFVPRQNREEVVRSILIPQRKKIVVKWIEHLNIEKDYSDQPAFQVYVMYNLLEMSKYITSDNKDNIEIQPLILDKLILKQIFEQISNMGKQGPSTEQPTTTSSSEDIENLKKKLEDAKKQDKQLKQNKNTPSDQLNASFQRIKELNIKIQQSGGGAKKETKVPPLNFIQTYKKLYVKHYFAQDLDQNINTGWIQIPHLETIDTIKATASEEEEKNWLLHNQKIEEQNIVKANNLAMLSSTRWCLANPTTAKDYLEKGDVYVYYRNNQPRIVITFDQDTIGEINGLGDGQSLATDEDEQIKDMFITKRGFKGQEEAKKKLEKRKNEGKQIDSIVNKINNGEWISNDPTPEDWAFFTYSDDSKLMKHSTIDDQRPEIGYVLQTYSKSPSYSTSFFTGGKQFHNAALILQRADVKKIASRLLTFLDNADPMDFAAWLDYDITKIPPNILNKIEKSAEYSEKFAMESDNDITKLTPAMQRHLAGTSNPLIIASQHNYDTTQIPQEVLQQIESNLAYTLQFIIAVQYNLDKITPQMIKQMATRKDTSDAFIKELLKQNKKENEIPIELRQGSGKSRADYGWVTPNPNIQENLFYKIFDLVETES